MPAIIQIVFYFGAETRVKKECLEVFARFGFPAQLTTDNATCFISVLFEDNCLAVAVKHKPTITYTA